MSKGNLCVQWYHIFHGCALILVKVYGLLTEKTQNTTSAIFKPYGMGEYKRHVVVTYKNNVITHGIYIQKKELTFP